VALCRSPLSFIAAPASERVKDSRAL